MYTNYHNLLFSFINFTENVRGKMIIHFLPKQYLKKGISAKVVVTEEICAVGGEIVVHRTTGLPDVFCLWNFMYKTFVT